MSETIEKPKVGQKDAFIPCISADSHVTEPPSCYLDNIEPKYRDVAPNIVPDERRGLIYAINGIQGGMGLGHISSAGKKPSEIKKDGTFEDLHRGGWDPKQRLLDQDRDGIVAEMLYPSVGMVLCGHPDQDYKRACMNAYNRWMEEFCATAPHRFFGVGQSALRSVEETVNDIQYLKEAGFKTVMMPSLPGTEFDFDDVRWDPLWKASIELGFPLSFHISAGGTQKDKAGNFIGARGPSLGVWISVIRSVQDIIGMLIFSGVFDRYPELKIGCIEADAGWAPHMMYRMDHAYKQHRFWMKGNELKHLPSEYWSKNLRLTFQDDWTAFKMVEVGLLEAEMLMWANDFPHADATWPYSQELLAEHAAGLTLQQRKRILHDNVVEFYNLEVAA